MFSHQQRFAVARFRNVYDNRPRAQVLDFGGLRALLTEWLPPQADKTRTPCWSPVRYQPRARRGKKGVIHVSALVFDCDDGTPVEAARQGFSGWCQLGHTSWSHSTAKPKWRLVLPLAEPIPGEHWPAAFAAALKMWALFMPPGSQPDRRCRDASRMFFLPVFRVGQDDRAAWADPGQLLKLDYSPDDQPAAPAPAPQKTWQLRPIIRHKLHTSPEARAALGLLMGGTARAGVVRGVDCPGCSKPAARWTVDPEHGVGGYCGDEDCGWAGPLDAVAMQLGDMV